MFVPVIEDKDEEISVGRPVEKKSYEVITPQINEHDYIVTSTEPGNIYWSMREYLPEIKEKIEKLEHYEQAFEKQSKQVLCLENIKNNNKSMTFWTGLPNFDTFNALFEFFEPRAKNLRYWKGESGMPESFSINKKGPERKLA